MGAPHTIWFVRGCSPHFTLLSMGKCVSFELPRTPPSSPRAPVELPPSSPRAPPELPSSSLELSSSSLELPRAPLELPSSSPRAPLELPHHHHHHHHHHHPYYVWRWFETEALTLPQLRTFPSTSQLHCGGQPTRKPSTDADAEAERMSSQHGGGGVREHGVHRPLTTVMENCFGAFDDRGG